MKKKEDILNYLWRAQGLLQLILLKFSTLQHCINDYT